MTTIVRRLWSFTAILLTTVSVNGIDVEGNIKGSVVWDNTTEPYNIIGEIQIWENASLIIMPNVRVVGNNYEINTSGSVRAIGDADNFINLDSVMFRPYGTQSNHYKFKFEYCYFSDSSINGATGYAQYGGLIIRNCVLDNLKKLLYLWYPQHDSEITNCIIYNANEISGGLKNNKRFNIKYNLFYNDLNERYNKSKFLINNWAAYDTSEMVVEGNSFLSSENVEIYSLSYSPGYTNSKLVVKKNYYGTVNDTEIMEKIYDKNDHIGNIAVINHKPFLKDHHPNIPKLPFDFELIQSPNELTNGIKFTLSVSRKLKSSSDILKCNIPFEYQWFKNRELISSEDHLSLTANNKNYATYRVVVKSPLLIEDLTFEKKVGNISKIFSEKDGNDIRLNGNTKKGGTIERSTDLKNWRRLIKVSEGDFEVYVDPTEKNKEFFRVKTE